MFPGEDRWVAVSREDSADPGGKRDWVQLGDKHHKNGVSNQDIKGEDDWGNSRNQ